MQQKITKIIAALLAITLLYANSAAVISYAADNFLTDQEIESQKTSTNNANVEFDVYYDGGKHTGNLDIASEETKLNVSLKVKNSGYLKDAVVDFSSANFAISDDGTNQEVVQEFNAEEKTIKFNQINNGEEVVKSLNIKAVQSEKVKQNEFMKDNQIKLTATYVNAKGNEEAISKEITLHANWNMYEEAKAVLRYQPMAFVPYRVNGTNKLIVQGKITSGVENGKLPIKETIIEIDAKKINNELPEEVIVMAKGPACTNGDVNGLKFTSANYNYDKATEKVTVKVENLPDENELISFKIGTLDEYYVTYIYSEEVLNAVENTKTEVTYSANSSISLYHGKEGITGLTARYNGSREYIGTEGSLVKIENNAIGASLNKGYMYNNLTTAEENKRETSYFAKYTTSIPYAGIADSIEIKQGQDKFLTDNNEVAISDNAYNVSIKVLKDEFLKILGEDGTIAILNGDTEIATINKESTLENEGSYYGVDISNQAVSQVTIRTSKPVTEGNISIIAKKAIKKNASFTSSQIKAFKKLSTSITETINGIGDASQTAEWQLEEPTQKANIALNKNSLSTILKNENVEFSVTLENDTIDDVMFNNPVIKIDLPTNIEAVDIKSCDMYFDEELSINNKYVQNNENGTKTIVVIVDGQQTKYNNVAAQGATIKINTDITLNRMTPTTNTQVNLTVENNDTTTQASTELQYVAPTGIVTTNSVKGYDNENELIAISGEGKEALIPTNADAKEVTYSMNIINNYQNTLDEVVVLGRTPFAGNKDVTTMQDLGSNMDLNLTSAITVSNIDSSRVTVYYSENGEATKDLNNTSNGWTTSIANYANVKSYMIVINGTMNVGDTFAFSYKANIPANLEHNKSAYETYTMFFKNNKPDGTIEDKAFASKIGLTTGTAPKLDASVSSENANGTTLPSGSLLKYKFTISNSGTEDATDAILRIPVTSDNISYVEPDAESSRGYREVFATEIVEKEDSIERFITINLEEIKAKSKIEKEVWLLSKATSQEEDIAVTGIITYKGDQTATTNTLNVKLTAKYFEARIIANKTDVREKQQYFVGLYVNATDDAERKNTKIEINLPKELTLQQITNDQDEDITSQITNKNNKLTIDLGNIADTEVRGFILTFTTEIKDKDVTTKEISLTATVKADGIQEDSNTLNIKIGKPALKVVQTANIPSSIAIQTTEEFAYKFEIKNTSNIDVTGVELTDYLPEQLVYTGIKVTYPDGTTETINGTDENGNPYVRILTIEPEKTVIVEVNVLANMVEEDTEIINKASVSQDEIGTIQVNEMKNTIKKYVPGKEDEPVVKTQKIVGTVWIDANKNGIREVEETKVAGVTVGLLNNATGEMNTQVVTDANGTYAFDNVAPGKYTVIFLYDSANYSATKYQVEGADETLNSDAIDKLIVYEGKQITAAVTEEITVQDENKFDIDLGIVEDPKFDLKLDKIVGSITVNTSKATTEHEYNKNFAKIDFESKYADSSTMVVEYKIIVTNEGAIPGYVKKIADYLPNEMKFSTELNQDWYEGKDGTIYNIALANTIINPGESKEVKLVLTKNMTKESFGLITNKAEIYEASNDYGINDMDSTPGNQSTNEDDYSIANVLTGVKTGEAVIYTTLIITIIAIIGVGTYIIKKRVIK